MTAGTETAEGIAVMLADAAETVRFVAELPEEYVDEISGDSVITLHGKNMSGYRKTMNFHLQRCLEMTDQRQMRPVAAG